MESIETGVGAALRALPLKDMDPSLLDYAVRREAAALGTDLTSLTAAMEVAAYIHRDDHRGRRGALPVDSYVTHPFRLVLRLVRYGCRDADVLCAAALHDTVEDHPGELAALLGTASGDGGLGPDGDGLPLPDGEAGRRQLALAVLARAFGREVAGLVSAVTNPLSRADEADDDRLAAYQAHVVAVVARPRVFLVKVADFVDNAGSLHWMTDVARRDRLQRKYAPLVPALVASLAEHGDTLRVGPEGRASIGEHLDAIAPHRRRSGGGAGQAGGAGTGAGEVTGRG